MKKTFQFLSKLSKNNNREWMQENKPVYLEAKQEVAELVDQLIVKIGEFDEGIVNLTAKDCMFRINRDVRFSKNKNPYKTNFGAAITPGGRKTGNPTYYLHLEPGKSILAGGIYTPDAENLKKIRQEIDYNPEELKSIVSDDSFAKTFGTMQGEALKTAPKGYPKDHPNIELLRMKSFMVIKDLDDSFLFADNRVEEIARMCRMIQPFNEYFSVAIS